MEKRKSGRAINERLRTRENCSPTVRERKALERISVCLLNGGKPKSSRGLRRLLKQAGYMVQRGTNHDSIYNPLGEVIRGPDNRQFSLPRSSELSLGVYRKILKAVDEDLRERYPKLYN